MASTARTHRRSSTRFVPPPESVLCESCGYTLDGLPSTGNCPECGTPIELSTTRSPRIAPLFEREPSWGSFFATAADVVGHPKQFFKNLRLEPRGNSLNFRLRVVILLSLVAGVAAAVHYNWALAYLGFSPWSVGAIGISIAIAAFWAKLVGVTAMLINRPIVWLTTLESGFWGFRLPKDRVQKALDYHIAHTLPAAVVILLVILVHRALHAASIIDESFGTTYLYLLSGTTVLCVLWVFKTYTTAMKAIMFANAIPQANHSKS